MSTPCGAAARRAQGAQGARRAVRLRGARGGSGPRQGEEQRHRLHAARGCRRVQRPGAPLAAGLFVGAEHAQRHHVRNLPAGSSVVDRAPADLETVTTLKQVSMQKHVQSIKRIERGPAFVKNFNNL